MSIALGVMVRGNNGKSVQRIKQYAGKGIESFQIHWWKNTGNENISETSKKIKDILAEEWETPPLTGLGLYGNPLLKDREGEESRQSIFRLIESAELFGSSYIGLFTGRIPETSWERSISEIRKVFGDFCRAAEDNNVRLAFENCPMGGNEFSGNWNIAFSPEIWERLFNELSPWAEKVLGLEWEPAHQLLQGREPLETLKPWASEIIHVHGKDASLESSGFVQRLPGNGSSDWSKIFNILKNAGYKGSVDIEGYHDPEWSGEKEIPGHLWSLEYLKECRNMVY